MANQQEPATAPRPSTPDDTPRSPLQALHTIASRISRTQSKTARDDAEVDIEKEADGLSTEGEGEGPESGPESGGSDHNPDVRTVVGFKWFLILAALYSSAFLYGLDTTIAADVQGAVIETFGHVDQLAWMGAGFPMGSVCVILLVGSLYGAFNMKWVFVASVLMFEIGSAICGAAPQMNALIVGRVLAGCGGSGVYLGCLNYISFLATREERGRYIGGTGLFWGLGAVLGPVIGGAFSVSSATWRWAFYINLVIGALFSPVFFFYLPSIHPMQGQSIRGRIAKLDFVGFILNIGLWLSFTMAFTMAGGQWPWNDGRTIATFVVFGVVFILYALQQYFAIFTTTETRSFPGHLLKSRTQVLLYIATASNITAMFVITYFIPIYYQFTHGDSAIKAAIRLLPFVAVVVVVNVLAGHVLPKLPFYQDIYLVSGAFILLGGGLLMSYLSPDTSEGKIYGFTVLTAFGTGLTGQISYAVATLSADPKDMGHAISLQNVSQIGGSVIGLVLAGQIFQSVAVNNLNAALAGLGFSDEEIHGAVAGAQSTLFGLLDEDMRHKAVVAICEAMQKSFVLVVVAGAVLLVTAAGLKRERLFAKAAA